MQRRFWVRWATFALLLTTGVMLYLWFERAFGPFAWSEIFSSREELRAFVGRFDPYGPIAFFLLQMLQVIVAPIPGNITALAGGALFGLWPGFFLSSAALVVGSCIAFAMARYYGRPLVERFVPAPVVDKYLDSVADKHFVTLFMMFLLPFFPDDALCFISGLSKLRFRAFLLFVLIGRPPGMFVSNLVGAGVMEIAWWGWALIIAASAAVFWIGYRYKDRIDAKLGISGAMDGDS
ncbi:MAG: TVP38/TMEM64 family protein [Spirochaetaceae bacterium]|nr:MAG: TVP38/TMEM64 family protein [Spirochaetaceae bacterium]